MSNPAFPNLLKIGKSKKDPTTDRVIELNQTGVPEPFKVEYYAFVEDEDYLEKAVHRKFASRRPNKNREFFSVGCVEAIDAIRQLSSPHSKIKLEETYYVSPEELRRFTEKREKRERIREEKEEKQREQKYRARQKRYDAELKKADRQRRNDRQTSAILMGLIFGGAIGLVTLFTGGGTEDIFVTFLMGAAIGYFYALTNG
jgi:hypothetical protein